MGRLGRTPRNRVLSGAGQSPGAHRGALQERRDWDWGTASICEVNGGTLSGAEMRSQGPGEKLHQAAPSWERHRGGRPPQFCTQETEAQQNGEGISTPPALRASLGQRSFWGPLLGGLPEPLTLPPASLCLSFVPSLRLVSMPWPQWTTLFTVLCLPHPAPLWLCLLS